MTIKCSEAAVQPELPARCADSEIIKTGSRRAGPQAETRRRIMIRTSDRLAVLSCSDPGPGGHDGRYDLSGGGHGRGAGATQAGPNRGSVAGFNATRTDGHGYLRLDHGHGTGSST